MTEQPRGIRNNNALNLRYVETIQWDGLDAPPQDEDGYCRFVSSFYGLRAGAKDLHTKWLRDDLTTVRQIITKFAPAMDHNNVAAYVRDVSQRMNVDPDQELNLEDQATLFDLVKAMVVHEDGTDPYPDTEIEDAVKEALA